MADSDKPSLKSWSGYLTAVAGTLSAIAGLVAVLHQAGFFGDSQPPEPPQLQVLQPTLVADPADYEGPCPATVKFSGSISVAGGAGSVLYRFRRSNGGAGSLNELSFDASRSQVVHSSLELPAAKTPHNGWQRLEIVEPEKAVSEKAYYSVRCEEEEPPPSPSPSPVRIDLLEMSPRATWKTGQLTDISGNTRDVVDISWMGALDDKSGYVRLESTPLEDGTTRTALRTHPKWGGNGTIKGWLPDVRLPRDARFEAKIGFVSGARQTDGVRFIVYAHHRGRWERVAERSKGYSGRLVSLSADLSRYETESVGIELRVDSGPSGAQDWAVWVEPVILGHE